MLKYTLGAASAFTAIACIVTACGGDTSDPETTADDGTSRDDSTSADDSADDSTADDSVTDDSSEPTGNMYCSQTPPPNSNITTFTGDTYTAAASGVDGDDWGHDQSLTGTAFSYVGEGSTIDREQTTEGMRLYGTSEGYAGFGIAFGPCSDASQFYGIGFTIQGVLGDEGELQVQVQMAENYPLDDDRGACMFTSEDSKWDECVNNAYDTEGTNPDEAIDIQLDWEDFAGGQPIDGINSKELLGIQWQFNCGSTCEFDVVISNARFLEAPAEPLDLGGDDATDDAATDDAATDDAATDG
jgi:hypothetical protein